MQGIKGGVWGAILFVILAFNSARAAEFEAVGNLGVPNGNIGIGRSSPTSRLHIVAAGSGTSINLRIQNSSAADTVTFLDNGNIGIGLTTPTEKLHISGNLLATSGTLTSLIISGGLSLPNDSITDAFVSNTLTASELTCTGCVADSELASTFLKSTDIDASSEIATIVTDEIGSGRLVFNASPTFTTQIIAPLLIGGTDASNNLILQSTSNATKGKIIFGTSAYDEVNNRLGIGTTEPGGKLEITGGASSGDYGIKIYSGTNLVAWAKAK